jgi:hypothetical protein
MHFYVYEHRRNDTGAVFYIGKGVGSRLRSKQGRTDYWCRVVAKAGYQAVKVVDGLDEELALLAEMELIDKHRRAGVRLVNLTDGGEGMSGYKRSAESIERGASKLRGLKRPDISALLSGIPKSEEHRRKLSLARAGSTASDEARAKMSAARKGKPSSMLGKKHREESKEKTRQALLGDKNHFFGRRHSAETIAQIVAKNLGRKDSDETRLKKSIAKSGALNVNYGKRPSDDRISKQRATLMARPLLTCPHCRIAANEGNARRWHFDNCKEAS